mgnify:CR=1 FL=1
MDAGSSPLAVVGVVNDPVGDNRLCIENASAAVNESVAGRDVFIRFCHGAQIHLEGQPSSLKISNCTSVVLHALPADGSVFVENCNACVLEVGGSQVRIHNTHDSALFVHSRSNVILEECSRLKLSKLETEDAVENNWKSVMDFSFSSDPSYIIVE